MENDPLTADDAIVAKALRYAQIEDSLDTPAICAIADKRGRALRETLRMLQTKADKGEVYARIREILEGKP